MLILVHCLDSFGSVITIVRTWLVRHLFDHWEAGHIPFHLRDRCQNLILEGLVDHLQVMVLHRQPVFQIFGDILVLQALPARPG